MPTREQEQALRLKLVEIGRRLYEQGFIAGTDGNLSVRLGSGQMLTTPSGVHKGRLQPEQILQCDLEGRPTGNGRGQGQKPSSEIRMHVLVYQSRPDIAAAVHAHPPYSVALSLAGISLAECLLPEAALALGPIPTAPYATPTTDDVPKSIEDLLGRCYNALILARHGSLTLGETLDQAYLRLETLEHTARITSIARSIGGTSALPAAEVARIEGIAQELGIARPTPACSQCGTCGLPAGSSGGSVSVHGPYMSGTLDPSSSDFATSRRPALPAEELEELEHIGQDLAMNRAKLGNSMDSAELVGELTKAVLRRLAHDRVVKDAKTEKG